MKKIIIYSSFLLLIVGVACKKEQPKRNTKPPVTDPTFGGDLTINQNFLIDHDTVQYLYDVEAIANFVTPHSAGYFFVNTVVMNSTTLASGSLVTFKAPVQLAPEWHWLVAGNIDGNNWSTVVDYNNSMPLPSFIAFSSLPDVIDRNQDFVISLNSLTNATSATIKITGGPNWVFKTFSILPGTSSIQIPASELVDLTPIDALVEVRFQNENRQQINNRIFVFKNSILIRKQMKVN
jgi:hypothetical protein